MWSFSPVSGDGAARTGGRFNHKGESALYLSLDVMTSFAECTQGLTQRLHPLTMCEYDVDCNPVADLRTAGERAKHGVAFEDIACPWLTCLKNGEDAPSWLVVDRRRADGFVGLLTPSFVPNATPYNNNLVLWTWGADLPTKVKVFDPMGRLPKNQLSWPTSRP
jgi:RES domain-containing protein